jgi:hypothetical protein
MVQLQIEDAAEQLVSVQPQAVHPIKLPKIFWIATSVLAIDLLGIALVHSDFYQSLGKTEVVEQEVLPLETTVLREEIVGKTEELAQQHSTEPALRKLADQLEVLMNKFESEKMDAKEMLITLSEMDEALQSALESLQLETMEESMQELAKTLELAEATLSISKALEKGDYAQAASELKILDAAALESLSKPERKAMAEQMQSIADNAEKRNQNALKEAAQKMSDALDNSDSESGEAAADALANEVEKYGVRKGIGKEIAKQQMMLGQLKADNEPGNMSGGKGIAKSQTESQNWGRGSAGDPNSGESTNLQGQRQQQTLTGTLTEEGESIKETVDSQEMAAAQSVRQYREQYQQYQKLSEAVLDSEPIPLGQRQIIRRYFESIRPVTE